MMFETFAASPIRILGLCAGLAAGLLLSACTPMEPIKGCTLAAANRREVLRARAYLHPTIPSRLLVLHYSGDALYHTALLYRLPEGWCVYDDTFGTRQIRVPTDATGYPSPLAVARIASPGHRVDEARWFDHFPGATAVRTATGSVD